MKAKALKTIAEFDMLRQGDPIVVGLSGGADSVALLSLLCSLREELQLQLTACHVNHNLRGQESLRDENFVRELCQKYKVECRVLSLPVAQMAQDAGQTVEEAARGIRYRFFAETAGERGKIATAHNAGDNAETVLLNLTRGSGLRGLCGIPPVRDNIIRPLIACTRPEIEAYCRQQGLCWVEDSTNAGDDYARNRVRHHVTPVLRQNNPAFDRTVGEMTRRLRRDADFLDGLAAEAGEALLRKDGSLDRKKLLELPRPVSDRVLLSLLEPYGCGSGRMLELCRQTAVQGSGSQELCAGVRFCADAETLIIRRQNTLPPITEERKLPPLLPGGPMNLQLGDRSLTVEIFRQKPSYYENIYNLPLKNILSYDRIQSALVLRTRRSGDRFALPGRGISKSLKKLFNEEKVPLEERDRRFVLALDGGTVVWAEGFGPAAGFLPGADTQTFMILSNISGKVPGEEIHL